MSLQLNIDNSKQGYYAEEADWQVLCLGIELSLADMATINSGVHALAIISAIGWWHSCNQKVVVSGVGDIHVTRS